MFSVDILLRTKTSLQYSEILDSIILYVEIIGSVTSSFLYIIIFSSKIWFSSFISLIIFFC